MTQTLESPPARTLEPPPSPAILRRILRMTSAQYHQMIESGILPEDSSTELLAGIIVHKDTGDTGEELMGHGPKHRLAVRMLTRLAARIDSDIRHLQIQLPVNLAVGFEPEPDGAIILGLDEAFADRLPGPEDIATVIEVAYSSLPIDVEAKGEFYAAAGVAQYVIVNLRDGKIEIRERPEKATRQYRSIAAVSEGVFRLNLGRGEFLDVPVDALLP